MKIIVTATIFFNASPRSTAEKKTKGIPDSDRPQPSPLQTCQDLHTSNGSRNALVIINNYREVAVLPNITHKILSLPGRSTQNSTRPSEALKTMQSQEEYEWVFHGVRLSKQKHSALSF